MNLVLVLQESC